MTEQMEKIEQFFKEYPEIASRIFARVGLLVKKLDEDPELDALYRIHSAVEFVSENPDAETVSVLNPDPDGEEANTPHVIQWVLHGEHPLYYDGIEGYQGIQIRERFENHESLKRNGAERVALVSRALHELIKLEVKERTLRIVEVFGGQDETSVGPFQYIRKMAETVDYYETLKAHSEDFQAQFGYIYDILEDPNGNLESSMKYLESGVIHACPALSVNVAVDHVYRLLVAENCRGRDAKNRVLALGLLQILREDWYATGLVCDAKSPENLVLKEGWEGFDLNALVDYYAGVFEKQRKDTKSVSERVNLLHAKTEQEARMQSKKLN